MRLEKDSAIITLATYFKQLINENRESFEYAANNGKTATQLLTFLEPKDGYPNGFEAFAMMKLRVYGFAIG